MNKDKPEIIKIRLSSPFMVRTCCKHCGGKPELYYFLRNPTMWFNPRRALTQSEFIRDFLQHLKIRGLMDEPKHYTSASMLSHDVIYASYRPRLHRSLGNYPTFDVVEFVSCLCMKTSWAFSQKASSNKPEVTCRKARHRFPTKFEF